MQRKSLCASIGFSLASLIQAHKGCGTVELPLEDKLAEEIRQKSRRKQHGSGRHRSAQSTALCRQCIEIKVYFHLTESERRLKNGLFESVIPYPSAPWEWSNGEYSPDDDWGENDKWVLDDSSRFQNEHYSSFDTILDMIEDTMGLVNDAFSATPFRFVFEKEATTRTTNNVWTRFALDDDVCADMTQKLGQDDLSKLDVYLTRELGRRSVENFETMVDGRAFFANSQGFFGGDGVWMRYDGLRSGTRYGYILVHEIGHWLGLYHTFAVSIPDRSSDNSFDRSYEDPACSPNNRGDFVDDTPQHRGPSSDIYDCNAYRLTENYKTQPDTCPGIPGMDPLFNFMNYARYEVCFVGGEFTPNQIERMHSHWLLFRDHVSLCDDNADMEIEVVVVWDRDTTADNRVVLKNDLTSALVFDSDRDQDADYISPSISIDLCVPRSAPHTLTILDTLGNGFHSENLGLVEIFQDGVKIQTVRGNFGIEKVVKIPALTAGSTARPYRPTSKPSMQSSQPTAHPSVFPTSNPTILPTSNPTFLPTCIPTTPPSVAVYPTANPTILPSSNPTIQPSVAVYPTANPSIRPTSNLTAPPSVSPQENILLPSPNSSRLSAFESSDGTNDEMIHSPVVSDKFDEDTHGSLVFSGSKIALSINVILLGLTSATLASTQLL